MQLRLISALGLVAMLACAWLLSNNRKLFPWRTVIWGMLLQFVFAIFILKTPIGLRLFQGAQVVMDQLNAYAYEGAKMVFGPLADGEMLRKTFGPTGGYLMAYPLVAFLAGALRGKGGFARALSASVIAEIILFAAGISWLMLAFHAPLRMAASWGLYPFLLAEIAKVAAAAGIASAAKIPRSRQS